MRRGRFYKLFLPVILIAALLFSGTAFANDTALTGQAEEQSAAAEPAFTAQDIPAYDSEPYAIINDNEPFFSEDEITTDVFETYSKLDSLGRCGTAYANVCQELMPTEERESISDVKPTGWHNKKYDFVEGRYVYNRCHLIAFELAAENANKQNLITGTRYFNVTGMLPFENMVADYVKETDNHVLYRVTPVFEGDNLVADGVLMEAYSVEDEGDGICYCVFVYNVQPGVEIDYATGENRADGTLTGSEESAAQLAGIGDTAAQTSVSTDYAGSSVSDEEGTYVLNTGSQKFHKLSCSSVPKISDSNRQSYTGSRDKLIEQGYVPCGACKP